ncbi:hypothetical protein JW933_10065 [candidate division FCPU426 bacterium]|nr:hypothetical protein [candidate division FCPU426 bacterium]
MKKIIIGSMVIFWWLDGGPAAVCVRAASENDFSRLVVYDVRGIMQDETAIVLEQKGQQVTVWLKNYLGKRSGEVPGEEYRRCFDNMLAIRGFALKKKYRGRLLRVHAAKGMITLAWKDGEGKHVRSIKYFAPEHTLDDFRSAFNDIWGLSRYAILSLESFESPRVEFLEDAVYFLSGSGWMTQAELQKTVQFHRQRGNGHRLAGAIWSALDEKYPQSSEFNRRSYLEYCIKKGMIALGAPAAQYLEDTYASLAEEQKSLAAEIIAGINKRQLKSVHE